MAAGSGPVLRSGVLRLHDFGPTKIELEDDMNTLTKRAILALLAGSFALLSGCTRHNKDEHYYLIATNIKVPYWQTAASGFTSAAAQYGVTAELLGPDGFDPQAEVQAFKSAVAAKPCRGSPFVICCCRRATPTRARSGR